MIFFVVLLKVNFMIKLLHFSLNKYINSYLNEILVRSKRKRFDKYFYWNIEKKFFSFFFKINFNKKCFSWNFYFLIKTWRKVNFSDEINWFWTKINEIISKRKRINEIFRLVFFSLHLIQGYYGRPWSLNQRKTLFE